MSWLTIVLLAATAFLLLVPILTYLSSRRQIGRAVDSDLSGSGTGDRLIYFYSAKCAPCRSMTPIIDQLAEEHPQVNKVDVLSDMETARSFNIRATPTTVLVKDNRILDIALGSKTQTQLEKLLRRLL